MKDFDKWNKVKKVLDDVLRNPDLYFYEREIWRIHVGLNIGDEQNGKGSFFTRPFLILKKHNQNCFLACALTTVNKDNRYHFTFSLGDKYVSAILSQIKLIDSKRLISRIGIVDTDTFEEIIKATIEVNFQ